MRFKTLRSKSEPQAEAPTLGVDVGRNLQCRELEQVRKKDAGIVGGASAASAGNPAQGNFTSSSWEGFRSLEVLLEVSDTSKLEHAAGFRVDRHTWMCFPHHSGDPKHPRQVLRHLVGRMLVVGSVCRTLANPSHVCSNAIRMVTDVQGRDHLQVPSPAKCYELH